MNIYYCSYCKKYHVKGTPCPSVSIARSAARSGGTSDPAEAPRSAVAAIQTAVVRINVIRATMRVFVLSDSPVQPHVVEAWLDDLSSAAKHLSAQPETQSEGMDNPSTTAG